MTTKEIWLKGQRGSLAPCDVSEYEDQKPAYIVASVEDDKITQHSLIHQLEKLYPGRTFKILSENDGYLIALAYTPTKAVK